MRFNEVLLYTYSYFLQDEKYMNFMVFPQST